MHSAQVRGHFAPALVPDSDFGNRIQSCAAPDNAAGSPFFSGGGGDGGLGTGILVPFCILRLTNPAIQGKARKAEVLRLLRLLRRLLPALPESAKS